MLRFAELMDEAPDLIVDCPNLYQYVAETAAQLIVSGHLPLSFFVSEAVAPIKDRRCHLLAEVLIALGTLKSQKEVIADFVSLGLSVKDLVGFFPDGSSDNYPNAREEPGVLFVQNIKLFFASKNLGEIGSCL